jgi:hypothetical protein
MFVNERRFDVCTKRIDETLPPMRDFTQSQ